MLALLSLLVVLLPGTVQAAPHRQSSGPVYVVQEGDTLWDIALRFGVSMTDLMTANGISDAGQIGIGTRLVIPGLEGIEGELTTQEVGVGENLESLSRRYGLSTENLARLNRLSSPAELYAGVTLILPKETASSGAVQRAVLAPGQSLLELAVTRGVNPWSMVTANGKGSAWHVIPGEVLQFPARPGMEAVEGPGALPDDIQSLVVEPLPLVQGRTAVIRMTGQPGITLNGQLAGYELNFFSDTGEEYISLQGLHAMVAPGPYTLRLQGTLQNGAPFSFAQTVFVKGGDYLFDPVLIVNPETIDPAVTEPEEAEWKAMAATPTPEKLWDGAFISPAPPPFNECWPSLFGNRRSYNGSAYLYFHTGLDFCGGVGSPIVAPAAGEVVFAGPLTVRGNATIINHGWGVYTGYMHQSEIQVAVGDRVEAGQQIGLVGGTGRVTGPHLHWEIFVGGIQVDPLDWLERAYP